jgi:hypothetical protein
VRQCVGCECRNSVELRGASVRRLRQSYYWLTVMHATDVENASVIDCRKSWRVAGHQLVSCPPPHSLQSPSGALRVWAASTCGAGGGYDLLLKRADAGGQPDAGPDPHNAKGSGIVGAS